MHIKDDVYQLLIVNFIFCQSLALLCEELSRLASLEDSSTMVETSSKLLTGTWISEGCETRPGPEYVLRYYTFEEDGAYQLVQHHYWDDSCSSPQLSIHSNGKIQLHSSLVQPGAAAGNAKVTNIIVIPQGDTAVKELNRRVSTECPEEHEDIDGWQLIFA
ncbi:hypothetical protein HUJ05_009441 [Dendroctonus ponderosae]|nr:hypothetical protein HUJ05_009441 [Dendroctonus ponderosae]